MAWIAPTGGPMNTTSSRAQAEGEILVFGQEPVAGMDGLGTGFPGGVEDCVYAQVTLARRRRADQHRFVGEPDMARARVGFGIDGHRSDAQAAGGLDDPTGDLAAVRDQDFAEHGASSPCVVQFGLARPIHAAVRFSRKALMPSMASGVARMRAMRCAVSSTS